MHLPLSATPVCLLNSHIHCCHHLQTKIGFSTRICCGKQLHHLHTKIRFSTRFAVNTHLHHLKIQRWDLLAATIPDLHTLCLPWQHSCTRPCSSATLSGCRRRRPWPARSLPNQIRLSRPVKLILSLISFFCFLSERAKTNSWVLHFKNSWTYPYNLHHHCNEWSKVFTPCVRSSYSQLSWLQTEHLGRWTLDGWGCCNALQCPPSKVYCNAL